MKNGEKLYKSAFFAGYVAVLVMTFLPVAGNLSSIKLGPEAFQIRLDFLLHFAVYFVIAMYYLIGSRLGYSLFVIRPLLKYFLLIIFLALVTEMCQLWVPARAFNIFDLISNVAGAGLGAIICLFVEGRRS